MQSSNRIALTLGALALALIFVAGNALAPAAYANHEQGHHSPPGNQIGTMSAESQSVVTNATTPIQIQLEGDALTGDEDYFITWDPVNGTITNFDSETGTLTYTPFEGATTDEFKFVTIRFFLFSWFHSSQATVSITIEQPEPEQPEQTGGSINLAVVYQYATKIQALNGTIPSDNLSGYDLGNGAVVMDYQTFADLHPYISPTLAWAFDVAGVDFNSLTDGQKAWLYLYVTVLP